MKHRNKIHQNLFCTEYQWTQMMVGCESAGKERMSPFLSTGSCPQSRWAAQVTRQKPEQLSDIHCWFLFLPLSTHILWKFGLSASCLSSSIIIASHTAFSPHMLHLHILCLQQKTETINQQSFSVSLYYDVLISDKTQCSQCFAGCKTTIARCERSPTGPVTAASCITHFIRGCVRHERCRNSWLIPKRPKVQHYLEELAGLPEVQLLSSPSTCRQQTWIKQAKDKLLLMWSCWLKHIPIKARLKMKDVSNANKSRSEIEPAELRAVTKK